MSSHKEIPPTLFDLLHPLPHEIEIIGDPFVFSSHTFFQFQQPNEIKIPFLKLTNLLNTYGISTSEVNQVQEGERGIVLIKNSVIFSQPQSYLIYINGNSIQLIGYDNTALNYAVQTLYQILVIAHQETKQGDSISIPGCQIQDSPHFPFRGVMLDISRDKVPTMDTLKNIIDILSLLKYNQFQLYIEHTFAYQGHEDVWKNASPILPEEMKELYFYCKERFIDLVPNQNSFGHMHRWLIHPKYLNLAENEEGIDHGFSKSPEPYSLNPLDPQSISFLKDLYTQMLACCPDTKLFNVGCDETFDLGSGKSKKECSEKGVGRVYFEFLQKIHQLLKTEHSNVTMQYWGDIVLNHPSLIPLLPKDSIALLWGYEGDHAFEKNTKQFKDAKIPFYVCPGTSSWNSISGRTTNMINNLRSAAFHGHAQQALGFLVTDWGDHGHWQTLPISYPAYFIGAEFSWNVNTLKQLDDHDQFFDKGPNLEYLNKVGKALDLFVLKDKSHALGRLLLEMGNTYLKTGVKMGNQNLLWRSIMIFPYLYPRIRPDFLPHVENLQETLNFVKLIKAQLNEVNLECKDADLIKDEMNLTADMLEFSTQVCLLFTPLAKEVVFREENKNNNNAKDIFDKYPLLSSANKEKRTELAFELQNLMQFYKSVWLKRNREGGLLDSLGRLEHLFNCLNF